MKFIVIDGIDGSGKETQVKKLISYLEGRDKKVLKLDYPRYGEKSAAGLESYLSKGMPATPKQASALFAHDRFIHQSTTDLSGYDYIISDRYTSANIIHQGARIKDSEERRLFQEWLTHFEYEDLGLLRPTRVIYLYVHPKTALQNIASRGQQVDSHENLEHLTVASSAGLEYTEVSDTWQKIDCVNKDLSMRTREEIHKDICLLVDRL